MADSQFCVDCGGAGHVKTSSVDGSGGFLRVTENTVTCRSCNGTRGVGPAFEGDAVPADQAALDAINEAARRRAA